MCARDGVPAELVVVLLLLIAGGRARRKVVRAVCRGHEAAGKGATDAVGGAGRDADFRWPRRRPGRDQGSCNRRGRGEHANVFAGGHAVEMVGMGGEGGGGAGGDRENRGRGARTAARQCGRASELGTGAPVWVWGRGPPRALAWCSGSGGGCQGLRRRSYCGRMGRPAEGQGRRGADTGGMRRRAPLPRSAPGVWRGAWRVARRARRA